MAVSVLFAQPRGDAATASPQASPKTTTKKTAIPHMTASFRLHEAPHMRNIGEDELRVGVSSCTVCSAHVIFFYMKILPTQNSHFSGVGYRISPLVFPATLPNVTGSARAVTGESRCIRGT